jgi:ParB family transcriptional regulator, chromosome partitioning protein
MATRINRYLDSVSTFDTLEIDLIRFPSNGLRQIADLEISDLISSIRENGLLQPIIVRPRGEKFEVIAGCRRLEACRRLKHRKIKALIVELDDKTAYEIAITENVQRKTLDPLEEAAAFKRYCDEYGWGSQSELARKIGKSQEFVSHRIKLLDLPQQVKTALIKKEISISSAEELVWLKNESAKKKVAQECSDLKIPMNGVRQIVKALNSSKLMDEDTLEDKRLEVNDEGDLPRLVLDSWETGKERDFLKTVAESILILRIALVRLDDLIAKTEDPFLKQTIVSKRVAIHKLVDELIATRRRGAQTPLLAQRK